MQIANFEQNTLTLSNFEGPISFLVYLVQKSEINLTEISVLEITEQYLKYLAEHQIHDLDAGADFIDYTGLLIWLKSKKLLPSESIDQDLALLESGCPLDILPQLLEYCRFKKTAKELGTREDGQERHMPRGMLPALDDFPKPTGIERVSVEELQKLFTELLKRIPEKKVIQEETWRVADKIISLRELIQKRPKIAFRDIFSENPCKDELIVTFLGMLELMKIGEIYVIKDVELGGIFILRQNPENN